MLSKKRRVSIFLACCALAALVGTNCLAQSSLTEFQKILREKAAFADNDFDALARGETVAKILPAQDKREVVVTGLAPLQAPAEVFLQSFRENLTRKSNAAILEIGSFSSQPTIDDLRLLTFETRDLEDLKECVVGDCRLKLSAAMIERLHREVSWDAPDYQAQATELLKQMLVEYVRDYLARGDSALIKYNDKQDEVRLADEQRDLFASLGREVLPGVSLSKPGLPNVEQSIVWSKIKFGLKPVFAINQITIYHGAREFGPQVLIVSKQIYANHYFDSSLALTALLNTSGTTYLVYENRSRADGLGGVFGGMKRGIIEGKALESVKTILHQSQQNLEARARNVAESAPAAEAAGRNWKGLKPSRIQMLLLALSFTVLVLLGLGGYNWKSNITGRTT